MRYLLLILICSVSCLAQEIHWSDITLSPEWIKVQGYEPIPAGLSKAEIDRQTAEYMASLNWAKIPVQDLDKKKYAAGIPGEKQREKDQKVRDAAVSINSYIVNMDEQSPTFGAAWLSGARLELFKNGEFMRDYRIVYGKIPAFKWQAAK